MEGNESMGLDEDDTKGKKQVPAAEKRKGAEKPPEKPAEKPAEAPVLSGERGTDLPSKEGLPSEEGMEVKLEPGERPYCQTHNALMVATSSRQSVTYYRCQVPSCRCTSKVAREQVPIPTRPILCPTVSCQGKESYLEVDAPATTASHLSMVCPACEHRQQVLRPQFLAYNNRKRFLPEEEVSPR